VTNKIPENIMSDATIDLAVIDSFKVKKATIAVTIG